MFYHLVKRCSVAVVCFFESKLFRLFVYVQSDGDVNIKEKQLLNKFILASYTVNGTVQWWDF